MGKTFGIETEVQFDAAHRVPDHASKCKNVHGHRYRVLATAVAEELGNGEQTGMVIDFGFLKRMLTSFIHDNCDHGMVMFVGDKKMWEIATSYLAKTTLSPAISYASLTSDIKTSMEVYKCWCGETAFGKTYIVPFVPTAENLAKHWFDLLEGRVKSVTQGRARLHRIDVFETPTSKASYPMNITDL